MKISSKGRYGLAAMISMAQNLNNNEYITIISIAEKLGISKLYLEQVFLLLKHAQLVVSVKGAQGGYQLSRVSNKITVGDVLRAIEFGLFEKTERSVSDNAIEIDKSMETLIWDNLGNSITQVLDKIALSDLVNEAEKYKDGNNFMFYI